MEWNHFGSAKLPFASFPADPFIHNVKQRGEKVMSCWMAARETQSQIAYGHLSWYSCPAG